MGAVSAFTGRDYQPQPIQKREKEKRKRRREEKSETDIVHLGFCEEKKKRKETPSVARLFLAHASCQRSRPHRIRRVRIVTLKRFIEVSVIRTENTPRRIFNSPLYNDAQGAGGPDPT